jgi:hypothetical protein
VSEQDTKTLRYDWFVSEDGTRCEVREGYVDADAVVEHARHIGEARAELFRDFAYDHDMTLYGEPSPALAEAFEALAGNVEYTQFSFFQGLGSTSRLLTRSPHERRRRAARERVLDRYAGTVSKQVRSERRSRGLPTENPWSITSSGTTRAMSTRSWICTPRTPSN